MKMSGESGSPVLDSITIRVVHLAGNTKSFHHSFISVSVFHAGLFSPAHCAFPRLNVNALALNRTQRPLQPTPGVCQHLASVPDDIRCRARVGYRASLDTRSPNTRLPKGLRSRRRTLITETERVRILPGAAQDAAFVTWLDEQQQRQQRQQQQQQQEQHLEEILGRHDLVLGNSNLGKAMQPSGTQARSRLLELPAELREQIWMHAVTEWTAASHEHDETADVGPNAHGRLQRKQLTKRPIRMDRLNRPPPPPITRVSHQLRSETLHLYYQCNVFECWRPLFWLKNWNQSTFVDWLVSLGPEKTKWLQHIVLLYKREGELEHDVQSALAEDGFVLGEDAIEEKQELSEYEMCFEELGLPRHFACYAIDYDPTSTTPCNPNGPFLMNNLDMEVVPRTEVCLRLVRKSQVTRHEIITGLRNGLHLHATRSSLASLTIILSEGPDMR
ncbi:uncharacterized protein MYCFIDRAFT_215928 [Pseudocercospora fijiensis CIRAD86]|uniref:Uncharacterized protein n=1 Tax=Pseudocercospora fijiensis (strain CIRAD86) TaxID=383855 RepID=M2YUE2_PSEFD|nr:uncharacterized protein MYCFIDRAFT_215928 [Pseudocercospora fijiensis CIRAD86]EME81345.1 hypothetical protein MYCFIDRAFT_215928 [Pseudocercospora fijiensis CIRAD86]